MIKDDISLAQWALVEEIRAGRWTTLDFPKIAREDFGLNGIEFVNTLFAVPTATYLNELKNNAADHGVEMVLIMVDDEGDGCASTKEERNSLPLITANGLILRITLAAMLSVPIAVAWIKHQKKKHCNALLNLIIFAGICCWFKYKSAYRKSWWTFQRPRLDGCPYERS